MVKEVMEKEPQCLICMDDGKCRNSESHKDYEKNKQWEDGLGYFDCINYQEKKDGTEGQFMRNYLKNLQVKWKKEKEEPYESDFVRWSKNHS